MSETKAIWYLYIIETKGGKFYTGITTDLERRFQQHLTGKGARFFRTDPPALFRFVEPYENRSDASKAEYQTKQLVKAKKVRLINSTRNQWPIIADQAALSY